MSKTILQVFDFPGASLGEYENALYDYFEANNDTYYQWYPGCTDNYNLSDDAARAMNAALTDAGMELENHPFFHVLIHFSW